MSVTFGTWTFRRETRELLSAAGPVHISPKAFDLLGALLFARPRALSKAELKDRLWPDTAVAATNLPALVNEVRQVLGDDARRPRYVRTVQRYGYAFCGAVSRLVEAPGARGLSFRVVYGRREVALQPGEHVLGRSHEAAVFIDSRSVSRHHARIIVLEDGALLEDLGSKNGTFLRQERIKSAVPLTNGDDIVLGSVHVTFLALHEGSSTETGGSGRK